MKYYYAFVGQNATTGRPNSKTGKYNTYGDLIAFTSRKERDGYVDNYSSYTGLEYAVKCNKSSARQFFLGMSVYDYQEHLKMINSFARQTKQL